MAIDKVQEFALAFPHRSEDVVLSRLFNAGIVHLTSYVAPEDATGEEVRLASPDVCRIQREESLHRIGEDLELANATLSFSLKSIPLPRGSSRVSSLMKCMSVLLIWKPRHRWVPTAATQK